MTRSKFIAAGNEQLHYLEMGSGKKVLLAFHGYANDAAIFQSFEPYLGDEYTILSFDLPHHGKSKWTEDVILSKRDLAVLVTEIKAKYSVDKVSLLGYSMGGRVCLTVIELFPGDIDKVVLIASDGLTRNYFYYFFTNTFVGKQLFRHVMKKPKPYFRIIDWLKDKKRIDAARHRFAMQYIGTEHSRKFLLQVWPAMSALMPDYGKLKATIRQYQIPVAIFMGQYDKIIPAALAQQFQKGLNSVQVFVLPKGHRVFDNENAGDIARYLL